MKKLKALTYIFMGVLSAAILSSCASQLPPSGGDDDVTPPRVTKISPAPNTVNFRGNSIEIEFDEYVDRRSFEESLFISPRPEEVRINYGGKDVEIEFPEGLQPNRTYTFTIGRDLRDIRGSNTITEAIQFAISTGPVIDKGRIRGSVYIEKLDRLIIAGYIVNGSGSDIDPSKKRADFITQADENGVYSFLNLPQGTFRLFAIRDSDRNLLYNDDFDEISVASQDYTITDSGTVNVDFLMRELRINYTDRRFLDSLRAVNGGDTANFIYSSVSSGARGIAPNNRFYFYFKESGLNRGLIAESIRLVDTASGADVRIVYNWLAGDSLLQVFPQTAMPFSASLRFIFNFRNTPAAYYAVLDFKVIEESNLGKISGTIRRDAGDVASPVYLMLYKNGDIFTEFSTKVEGDSVFTFTNIPEGEYTLFSYIDKNNNASFDKGKAFPFLPAEPFIIYRPPLNLRGSWSVDNILLEY